MNEINWSESIKVKGKEYEITVQSESQALVIKVNGKRYATVDNEREARQEIKELERELRMKG